MALTVSDRINTLGKKGALDFRYGPFNDIDTALDDVGNKLDNGVTVGIVENGEIVEYIIQGLMSGSPTRDNFVRKINNATITIHQDGQADQTFTLNQGDNVTISISKGVSTWDEITGKPVFATVATSGSYDDLSNKPTIPAAQVNSNWNSESGASQILNKPSNLVYFG